MKNFQQKLFGKNISLKLNEESQSVQSTSVNGVQFKVKTIVRDRRQSVKSSDFKWKARR